MKINDEHILHYIANTYSDKVLVIFLQGLCACSNDENDENDEMKKKVCLPKPNGPQNTDF